MLVARSMFHYKILIFALEFNSRLVESLENDF